MKFGVMNHPRENVLEEINWVKNHDFDFIDLTYEPPFSDNYNAKEIRAMLLDSKLEVVGHTSPSLPAIFPVEEIRKASLDELKKAFDFLKSVGAEKVNIHPFYYSSHQDIAAVIDANISFLGKAIRHTNEIGLKLMLENSLAPFDTAAVFKRILSSVPDLFIHLDIGHTNINNNPLLLTKNFFKVFGQKIIHLHIHDNNGKLDQHLPVGCGDIDWQMIFKLLKSNNYQNTMTLEVFCLDRDYLIISRQKVLEIIVNK
ncbi:MAG: sugar phosphate isomerase/epimerase family protein [Patescibacteria group bacterium]